MAMDPLCKDLKRRFGGNTKAIEAYSKAHRMTVEDMDEAARHRVKGTPGFHKLGR